MRERFCRPISSTSSNPSVVRIAVTAPFCSSTALVATVVPWMNRSTAEAGAPGEREHAPDGGVDALEQVLRGGGNLGQDQAALAVERHDVREGAADVDADLQGMRFLGPAARF